MSLLATKLSDISPEDESLEFNKWKIFVVKTETTSCFEFRVICTEARTTRAKMLIRFGLAAQLDFQQHFSAKVQSHLFSNPEKANKALRQNKADLDT